MELLKLVEQNLHNLHRQLLHDHWEITKLFAGAVQYIYTRFKPRFISFIDYIYGKGKNQQQLLNLWLVQNMKSSLMFSCISTVEAYKLCLNNKVGCIMV